jgi:hypothetical protein
MSRNRKKRTPKIPKVRNAFQAGKFQFGISGNLLHNMTVRDSLPIRKSFDEHYGRRLKEIDELFSDCCAMAFHASQVDIGLKEE